MLFLDQIIWCNRKWDHSRWWKGYFIFALANHPLASGITLLEFVFLKNVLLCNNSFLGLQIASAYFAPRKGIQIPDSGRLLLVESGILGFAIRNTSQEFRNPIKDRNPESKFLWQRLKFSVLNLEPTAWNPESKTVLDSLTWWALLIKTHSIFICCSLIIWSFLSR